MVLHEQIRTGLDSIFSDQDWTRTEKFHSLLISAVVPGGPCVSQHKASERR